MLFIDYLLLILVVTVINTIPAFMPETWVVLSFFYLHFHLSFIITILIGALFGTVGRISLAIFTRKHLHKIFPQKLKKNYQDLGTLFTKNQKPTISQFIALVFIPLPESQVFMAAGLANISLYILSLASIIRSLIIYSFWVKTTSVAITNFQSLFNGHGQLFTVAINLISFSLLIIIGIIPWGKLINKNNTNL